MMDTKTHFLVVNDEATKRRIIVALLKELNFIRVSEASDGDHALKAFHHAKSMNVPIEFLITGCKMPFVNGLELIRALRAQETMRHLPVLMITDAATRENIIDAVEAGADGYLVRPFRSSQLLKKIESIQAASLLRHNASSSAAITASHHHVEKPL
jgi:two-component system chemotaxis response regulator CheY